MAPKIVNKDEKMSLIMEAAVSVMSVKGFHNTKMEEIAREAGVGKGTIYEYFESKEDLFASLVDYYFGVDDEFLNRLRPLSFEARISEVVDFGIAIISKKGMNNMFSLHVWAAITNDKDNILKNKLKNFHERHLNLIIEFMKDRLPGTEEEIEIKARLLFAVLDGLLMQFILYPEFAAQKELIKQNILKMFE